MRRRRVCRPTATRMRCVVLGPRWRAEPSALEAQYADQGVSLGVSGPWPPYRFCPPVLDVGPALLRNQEDRLAPELRRARVPALQHLLENREGPLRIHLQQRVQRRQADVAVLVAARTRRLRPRLARAMRSRGDICALGGVGIAQPRQLPVDARGQNVPVLAGRRLRIAVRLPRQPALRRLEIARAAQPVARECRPVERVPRIRRARVPVGDPLERLGRPLIAPAVQRLTAGAIERVTLILGPRGRGRRRRESGVTCRLGRIAQRVEPLQALQRVEAPQARQALQALETLQIGQPALETGQALEIRQARKPRERWSGRLHGRRGTRHRRLGSGHLPRLRHRAARCQRRGRHEHHRLHRRHHKTPWARAT